MAGSTSSAPPSVAQPSRHRPTLTPLGHHTGKPPIPLHRPVTLVGSRSNARIHLTSSSVSKAHALIVKDGSKIYIRDLASRSKVFINGQEQREADLADGDMLKIGSFLFKYTAGRAQQPASKPARAAVLRVSGADYPVAIDQRVLLIGRRPICDIHLLEESVSTAHAVIFEMDGQHHVRDLGSRSGTFVNGVAVHQHPLNPGDTVRIGETTLAYTPGESSLVGSDEVDSDTSSNAIDLDALDLDALNLDEPQIPDANDQRVHEAPLAANDLHIVDDRRDSHDSLQPPVDDEIDFRPHDAPAIPARAEKAIAETDVSKDEAPFELETVNEVLDYRSAVDRSDEDETADLETPRDAADAATAQAAVPTVFDEAPVLDEKGIDDALTASDEPAIDAEMLLPRRGWRAASSADALMPELADDVKPATSIEPISVPPMPIDVVSETAEVETPAEVAPAAEIDEVAPASVGKGRRKGGKAPVVSKEKKGKKGKRAATESASDSVQAVDPADQPAIDSPLAEIIEVPPLDERKDETVDDVAAASEIEKVAASRTRRPPKSPVAEQDAAADSKSKKSRSGKVKSKEAKTSEPDVVEPAVPDVEATEEPEPTGLIVASREDDDIEPTTAAPMSIEPAAEPASASTLQPLPLAAADKEEVIDLTEPTPESALSLRHQEENESASAPHSLSDSIGGLETVDALSDTGLSRAVLDLTGDVGQPVEEAVESPSLPMGSETMSRADSDAETPLPVAISHEEPTQAEPTLEQPKDNEPTGPAVTAMPPPPPGLQLGANSVNYLGGMPLTLPPLAPPPFGSIGITVDESAAPVEQTFDRSAHTTKAIEDQSAVESATETAEDVAPSIEPETSRDSEADIDSLIDEILETVDDDDSSRADAGTTVDDAAVPFDAAAFQLPLTEAAETEVTSTEAAPTEVREDDVAADQLAEWLSKASLYAEGKAQPSGTTAAPDAPTIDESPTSETSSETQPVDRLSSDASSDVSGHVASEVSVDEPLVEDPFVDRADDLKKPASIAPHAPTIIPIPPPPAGRNRGRRRGTSPISENTETSSLRDDERIPPFQPHGGPLGGERGASASTGFSGLAMPPVRDTDVFAQMSPPATSDDESAADSSSHDADEVSGNADEASASDIVDVDHANGATADPFGSLSATKSGMKSPGALTPMDLVRDDELAARNGSGDSSSVPTSPRRAPLIGRVEAPRDLFFSGVSKADADFGPRHRNGNGLTNGKGETPAPMLAAGIASRRASMVAFDGEQNGHNGLEAAHAERRRKLRRVPILLGLMLLLMLASAAAIWYALPPVSTAEAAVTFDNFTTGHTQYEKGEIQKRQIILLGADSTRHLAKLKLQQDDPEVSAGFIDDADEYGKVANRPDSWSETRQGTLLIQHRSNDERGDKARVRAVAEALIAANADTLTQQATDAKNKFDALSASLAREDQELSEMDKREQSLRTLGESAPSAADIGKLKTQVADLDKKWSDAVAAVKSCEAELQQLRAAPAGGAADANGAAGQVNQPAASATDLDKLQGQLKDVSAQLAATIASRKEQSIAARKALDASFEDFAKQIADSKQLMKDSPELASYIAAVQKLQENLRAVSDEMVRRQEQYSAQMNDLKANLTEKMEQRRVDQMHADPKIVELNERIEVAKRQMNAAISAGMKQEADEKQAEVKLLENLVKAQEELVPNDGVLSQMITQLSAIKDAMEKNIVDDRKRNDQFFEQQQKDFMTTAHVQQMPEAQKAVAADLEKKLADVNAARQQYNQVATETGVDDDLTKGLRTQVATLQTALDEKKKQLADQSQRNLSLEQEKTRTEAIAAKEKQLTELNKAEVDARQAYTNNEKDLRDKQALADNARASMDQLLDLQRDKEIKTRQRESDKANFESFRKDAEQAVKPHELSERDVYWSAAPDIRPLYIGSVCAVLLVTFVAMAMHTLHTAAQDLSLHSLSAGSDQLAVAIEPITDPDDVEKPEEAATTAPV